MTGDSPRTSRRAVLGGATAVLAALAGCSGGAGVDDSPADATGTETTDATTTGGDTTTAAGTAALDLREANVVGVSVTPEGDRYRFDVTLYHDDDGEDGYADWWQVERRDGTRLGRRDLLHAHSTAPFTRSETVAVPADAACVVVRGHDRTHGYGGRAMLVTPDTGATRAVDQGSERRSLAGRECP